ncbi:MAG: hypothetical protein ACE5GE_05530 [Phycisphaerae bacterium]
MLREVLEVVVHPFRGTVRAARHWPARTCHLRSLLALVTLGVISTGGCLLFFKLAAVDIMLQLDDVQVAFVTPLLAGCGLAGAMVLLGGTAVRIVAHREWSRSIDENQYVRLMAAAMWALVPFNVAVVIVGGALAALLKTPAVLLGVVPVGLAVSFAVLARSTIKNLYRAELGERLCDRCGYSLLHLMTARCPECGETFPEAWLEDGAGSDVAALGG